MWRLPFSGATDFALAIAKLHQPAPDPRQEVGELSSGFASLVRRCLMRNPNERHESARKLVDEIRRLRGRDDKVPVIRAQTEARSTRATCVAAARSLRAAVARSPSSPDVHELLGLLLLEAGLVDVALQRLATASRMNPTLHMNPTIPHEAGAQARDAAPRRDLERLTAIFAPRS